MTADVLTALKLRPEDVLHLPAKGRNALIRYLMRWQRYEVARDCLLELLDAHRPLLSAHDHLAHVYMALGSLDLALSTMARRHELKVSSSSRIL
jgi:Tfp pilus assembly protein PilF